MCTLACGWETRITAAQGAVAIDGLSTQYGACGGGADVSSAHVLRGCTMLLEVAEIKRWRQ